MMDIHTNNWVQNKKRKKIIQISLVIICYCNFWTWKIEIIKSWKQHLLEICSNCSVYFFCWIFIVGNEKLNLFLYHAIGLNCVTFTINYDKKKDEQNKCKYPHF